MIWKHYLKLSVSESYSKLSRASKAAPPPPHPRRNRVKGIQDNQATKKWRHYTEKVDVLVFASQGMDMIEMMVEFVLKRLQKGTTCSTGLARAP